ncbi:23S rRNA (guanosine(2251)-2'-O)-methyltransferase RlmB [Desulforamulus aquiferis]|uniref:23S rRNA (Guanosine(2251)-2'-O)-methyltransferase RlmB n=1 Tax=Desulforamulus aquiferis TaxID=1397668 RepID=A0AAW7ZID3_9FIRM|nr:23S rRNA (guanosine(2251)-2'-O)-methyltransferase RlmB [Desulforamulus aquiferis]MDO7788949.1 23S rRNA (guanosine(2251)-2'-O)-methyltransferase RlmB [Desulforamulus aquiferis]RYD03211.1 RNA methyltransferase [Desulforamulus aquiferis]
MSEIIAGRNPVREALRSGRPINKIVMAKGSTTGPVSEIIRLARDNNVPVQMVERSNLDKLVKDSPHQGVIAYVAPKEYVEIEDILQIAKEKGQDPFIVMLDEINDPHNLGAIIRTVDAAGAHGVIIPQRRSVALTATVAKASAGAVEYVPVARVTNLDQTIRQLKDMGLWVVGADMDGKETFWEAKLSGPLVLVIGGEGKGIGRLLKERCDMLVRLPMAGRVGSLNASVAAALLVYEVIRQRG